MANEIVIPNYSVDALMNATYNAMNQALVATQMAQWIQQNHGSQALAALMQQYGNANNYLNNYYDQAQMMNAPYQQAGYGALGALMDSYGLARPQAGYGAVQNAAQQYMNVNTNPNGQLAQLAGQYAAPATQNLGLASLLGNYGGQNV